MFVLQDLSYLHPNKELLFKNLHLAVHQQEKIALVGNNGSGKSTLLRIMAGILFPAQGTVITAVQPYYVPQHFGQFDDLTLAQALQVNDKLQGLKAVLNGDTSEKNFALLNDDWTIEDRCHTALAYWNLQGIDLEQKMNRLSGGQKTKVFLAGIMIHEPEMILLDEPSNHLDSSSREILYNFIRQTNQTLVVVSHDRQLLNQLDQVFELNKNGVTVYGGNYDFYARQKAIEKESLNHEIQDREKALRKARETEREANARQQKLDARGKKKQEKAGLPTISMKTFQNKAEKSTARTKEVHAEKVENLSNTLSELRKELPDADKMKIGFEQPLIHKGKTQVEARGINYQYGSTWLWKQGLDLVLVSGQRMAIKGNNGSGKTTLIKLLLGELEPQVGTIHRTRLSSIYIDQDYSLIRPQLTVYEQAQFFNTTTLPEHDIKTRLNRFLFNKEHWEKPCMVLSGGEKMRLLLCCLTIGRQSPDLIVLDEPTNNLDLQNTLILTQAINTYSGTLIVVSHDDHFLADTGTNMVIEL